MSWAEPYTTPLPEFEALSEEVQDGLTALLVLLKHSGPLTKADDRFDVRLRSLRAQQKSS